MDKHIIEEKLGQITEHIERLKERDDLTESDLERLSFLLRLEADLQKELETLPKKSSIRRETMLVKLFKLAHSLDKRGHYDEAKAIDEVMQSLSQRVGLNLEDLVSLADYCDEQGDTATASKLDEFISVAAKKKTKK